MLNIRTLVLSFILVVALLLTVGLLTAGTEVVSNASSNLGGVSAIEEEPSDLNSALSAPSYRIQFGECYDVSILDLAACRGAGQTSAQTERPPLDECYDVSILDLAACRGAGQTSAQTERPPLDECYDVSIWDLAACRNASQAPIP